MSSSICECCGQTIKVYKRGLRKGLIVALLKLYHVGRSELMDLDLPFGIVADFPKLRFWGLVYKDRDSRDCKHWMITKKGKDFLFNNLAVPRYVYIYNNNLEKHDEEMITIKDVGNERVDFKSVLKDSQNLVAFRNNNGLPNNPVIEEVKEDDN